MASSETEYYNRLDLIVVRVGTVTARRLLEKRVVDLKPEHEERITWTVNKFIESKRRQIMQMRPKETMKFLIFPKPPLERDYEKWDISVLVFVLAGICQLDDELCNALKTIKDIRNNLDHLNDPAVKLATYQKKLADLKRHHDLCLEAIDDKRFMEEQKEMFQNFEHEPLSVSEMTKFFHKKAKEQQDVKSILTNQQTNIKTILQKLDRLVVRASIDFPPRVSHPDVDDDIVQQFDVELKLLFSECDKDKAKQVLLDAFKRQLAETREESHLRSTELEEAVGRAFEDMLRSNYKIVDADEGCVGLHIRFKSPRGLLTFFEDYFEGTLQSVFKPVKAALQTQPGLENMTLDVVIYEDEFKRVVDKTVTFLSSCLSGAEESYMGETDCLLIEDDRQSPQEQSNPEVVAEIFQTLRRVEECKTGSLPDPDLLGAHCDEDEDEDQTYVKTDDFGNDFPSPKST